MKTNNCEQRSDEWFHIRKGKITGTQLKSIMGTPKARKEAMYEILAERLTVGIEDDYENAMDRGTRLEPEAVAAFQFETGLKVDSAGLCQDDDNDKIANSPDGLIGDDMAIEVKCMGGKNHLKMWLENEIPDEYYYQVLQYFVVNEKLKKLYFVAYNPDIPTHSLHIIEVERNEKEVKKAREAQEVFLKEVDNKLNEIIKL